MSGAGPIRILIAEDVPTDAELSVRELRRAGLRLAHRVVDTEAAFRGALAQFAPQVILSDFAMPQFDGMQALELARELAPDTPFIFVSGTLGEEYAIRALKKGASDYVLKTNLIRLPSAVERALAEAAASAERRRTEAALAETRARLERIRDLGSAVNAAIVRLRERGELLQAFCRIAVERGGFQAARLLEIDPASGAVSVAVVTDETRDSVIAVVEEYNRDPARARSLLAEALRSGRAAFSNDAAADPRVLQREAFARAGVGSLACLPYFVDGRVAGAVVLRARERGFFDSEEMRLLGDLTANLAFALELIEKQKQVNFLAYYDPLTGLANRALLQQRLIQAIDAARSGGRRFALVAVDIERFRAINDAFGNAAGDSVLQRMARLAVEVAGEGERVARLGANQFALLLPALREAGDVGRLLERAAPAMLDTMIEVRGQEVRVAAKAGVAIFPEDGADAEALVKNAEAALKRAKTTGERYTFYAPSINARVSERLELEAKLRRAVERGELALAFQPKVHLDSRRIAGMEALLRWSNGGGGAVSPADFVPLLEETGLIREVGRWAMRQAVAAHRGWLARGLAAMRVAVNVSALQLRDRAFVEDVRAALDGATGEACGLDLEITESLLMENIETSLERLREVRALGVNIALDDFGTGYSSLAYLSRLPIDTLKIDRAFIHRVTENAEDTTIVTAMISLAHALHLKVVAEGVETEAQAQLLRLLRCDQMQGYLFSRALPVDAAAELIASHAPAA